MFSSKSKSIHNDEKIAKKMGEKGVNEAISDYAGKTVDLELIKVVSESLEKRLEKRKKDFVGEKKKLENLHKEIWNSMDGFCESIWKFSAAHDFAGVINNYLDKPLEESSKEAEDPEKIRYLQYQINLLTQEIKSLQENLKALDFDKLKIPLRESQNNQQELKIDERQVKKLKKINSLKNKKQVTLQVKNSPELNKKPLKSIVKSIRTTRNSTFSLKRKSRICEKFENDL